MFAHANELISKKLEKLTTQMCLALSVYLFRFWTVELVDESENASFEGHPKRVSKEKLSCKKMVRA